MNPKPEIQASRADTLKLASAILIALIGLTGFYWFSEHLLLVRVLGLLVAVGVAVGIALTTERGASVLDFAQNARAELRKVVWPSRAETLQTSLAVFVMVVIMGLFLWLLDMLLFWVVRLLTGQ